MCCSTETAGVTAQPTHDSIYSTSVLIYYRTHVYVCLVLNRTNNVTTRATHLWNGKFFRGVWGGATVEEAAAVALLSPVGFAHAPQTHLQFTTKLAERIDKIPERKFLACGEFQPRTRCWQFQPFCAHTQTSNVLRCRPLQVDTKCEIAKLRSAFSVLWCCMCVCIVLLGHLIREHRTQFPRMLGLAAAGRRFLVNWWICMI